MVYTVEYKFGVRPAGIDTIGETGIPQPSNHKHLQVWLEIGDSLQVNQVGAASTNIVQNTCTVHLSTISFRPSSSPKGKEGVGGGVIWQYFTILKIKPKNKKKESTTACTLLVIFSTASVWSTAYRFPYFNELLYKHYRKSLKHNGCLILNHQILEMELTLYLSVLGQSGYHNSLQCYRTWYSEWQRGTHAVPPRSWSLPDDEAGQCSEWWQWHASPESAVSPPALLQPCGLRNKWETSTGEGNKEQDRSHRSEGGRTPSAVGYAMLVVIPPTILHLCPHLHLAPLSASPPVDSYKTPKLGKGSHRMHQELPVAGPVWQP